MPGRMRRKKRGRQFSNQAGRKVRANDLVTGMEILRIVKKLAIPLAAIIAADVKKPDGFFNKKLKSLRSKIPFKLYMNPDQIEATSEKISENKGELPPLRIESTSKPVDE